MFQCSMSRISPVETSGHQIPLHSLFSIFALQFWNKLLEKLNCAESVGSFKSGLKTVLFTAALLKHKGFLCSFLSDLSFYLIALNNYYFIFLYDA